MHFLWKLNSDSIVADPKKGATPSTCSSDIGNWRRRIYFLQFEQSKSPNVPNTGFLLYGSEKEESIVDVLSLKKGKCSITQWNQIRMEEKSKTEYEKRLFDDIQYELAFLQMKTHFERAFPKTLYPFEVKELNDDGTTKKSYVLACEAESDRKEWAKAISTFL